MTDLIDGNAPGMTHGPAKSSDAVNRRMTALAAARPPRKPRSAGYYLRVDARARRMLSRGSFYLANLGGMCVFADGKFAYIYIRAMVSRILGITNLSGVFVIVGTQWCRMVLGIRGSIFFHWVRARDFMTKVREVGFFASGVFESADFVVNDFHFSKL